MPTRGTGWRRVAGVQRNFPDLRVTPRPGPAGRLVRSRWRWQTLGGSKQRGGGQPRRGGDEELAHVHHHPINSDGSGGAIPDAARRYRVNSATRPVSMPVPSQPFGRQGFYEPDLGRLGLTHRTSGSSVEGQSNGPARRVAVQLFAVPTGLIGRRVGTGQFRVEHVGPQPDAREPCDCPAGAVRAQLP